MTDPCDAATTVCLLTPLAAGGLAAVRLFGAEAVRVADRLFRAGRGGSIGDLGRQGLALGRVSDPTDGEPIDQAIVRVLPGGLGVEFTLHGGVRVVQRVVAACQSLGAGRLDPADPAGRAELWRQCRLLAQAEGQSVPALRADVELALPSARTAEAACWLVGQTTVGLAAHLAGLIEQARRGRSVGEPVERLLAAAPSWASAVAGIRVAMVGPANAGKSTLLNALAGAEAAIVADQPGTTRDYLSRWVNLDGLAGELIDTAGLREPADGLEGQAARLAGPVIRSADLRLILLDGCREPTGDEQARIRQAAAAGPVLWAVNKADLPGGWDAAEFVRRAGGAAPLSVSALTGLNLVELRGAVRRAAGVPELRPASPGLFANRQVELVRQTGLAVDPSEQADLLAQVLNG